MLELKFSTVIILEPACSISQATLAPVLVPTGGALQVTHTSIVTQPILSAHREQVQMSHQLLSQQAMAHKQFWCLFLMA